MSEWSDVCPLCHKNDQVQKVTSVVASGSLSGHHSVEGYEGHSSSQTDLSSKLAFGPLPEPNDAAGCIGMGCLFIVALVVAAFAVFVTANTKGSVSGAISSNMTPFVLIVSIPVVCLVIIFLIARVRANNRKDFKKSQAAHERMRAPWERLYYCHRNDVVFLPDQDSRSYADAGKMMTYLRAHT